MDAHLNYTSLILMVESVKRELTESLRCAPSDTFETPGTLSRTGRRALQKHCGKDHAPPCEPHRMAYLDPRHSPERIDNKNLAVQSQWPQGTLVNYGLLTNGRKAAPTQSAIRRSGEGDAGTNDFDTYTSLDATAQLDLKPSESAAFVIGLRLSTCLDHESSFLFIFQQEVETSLKRIKKILMQIV